MDRRGLIDNASSYVVTGNPGAAYPLLERAGHRPERQAKPPPSDAPHDMIVSS